MTEAEASLAGLRQYLAFCVEARHRFFEGKDHPGPYLCMEDFVLQEGDVFQEFSPHQPTLDRLGRNRYKPRMVRQCFDNSYRAAVASRGHLRYVEGYAAGSLIPVAHAWNIDADGKIVDTTWCGNDTDLGRFTRPTPGLAYIGVTFSLDYVRNTRTDNNTSMIDQWEKGWPLLQQKFVRQDYDMEVAA